MSETADKKEVFYEHLWGPFVVIPVQEEHYAGGSYAAKIPATFPLFITKCRNCSAYFTQPLLFSSGDTRSELLEMPQYGCVGPEI